MKISLSRRFSARAFALLATLALAAGGCVTTDQVKDIVRDANYQMLVASAPGSDLAGLSPDGKTDAAGPDAAAKINAFLAANPDDPAMAAALRLRQSLLYLSQQAFALADATHQQIAATALLAPRDKALFAAYADLRWWNEYAMATPAVFFSSQKDAAMRHMAALAQQAASLVSLPDLRDYLLEMRAWIGLKLGLASPELAFSVETLQDAVDGWTAGFTAPELQLLVAANFKSVKPFDLATRRVIRARVLLTTLAAQTAGAPNARLTFKQEAVNQFYATLPH
jgi:hypothetical protein